MSDPFKVLGIEPGASEADIKKAYKKLAMEHHPDRHPDDKQAEERFKEISGAYETLKKNNWKYENFGGQFGFNGFSTVNINIDDLFNQAFGSYGPFGRGRKVGHVKTGKLYISLEEAYYGCTKKISISDTINCASCKGVGYKLSDQKCATCNGTGQQRTTHGAISMVITCPVCKGFGRAILAICLECGGSGKKSIDQELDVNIPPGTHNGTKINPNNNLQIQILYSPHKEYKIMNNMIDISSTREIDMFTAVLGGTILVNTLAGIKNVKIPSGCQPEAILRIKQAGLKIKNKAGDHLLNIKVKLPIDLTTEQRKLLQTLKEQLENNDGKK
jgi:molecular chaperone DnaJ